MNKKQRKGVIIGSFGTGREVSDGQRIKTRIAFEAIEDSQLFTELYKVELDNVKKKPFSIFVQLLHLYFRCDYIFLLVSRNGMKILYPMLYYLYKIKRKSIIQLVIGGGLAERTKKNSKWIRYLSVFSLNCCESRTMIESLKDQGLSNVCLVPNFRPIPSRVDGIVQKERTIEYPIRLCTFSRVARTKGIEIAIDAVKRANKKYGDNAFELNIYGNIDQDYKEDFEIIKKGLPSYIKYCGVLKYDNFYEELSRNNAVLFPTFHEGEGFPGTIIDAFSCGIPVIASDWHYNKEIVGHGCTGYIFSLDKIEELDAILELVYNDPDSLSNMKDACVKEAQKYTPKNAMSVVFEYINSNTDF